jgi:glycosyltransferase involved in cell wall biosynthesis
MRVALIVTTYNWPEALALILASVRGQSRLPDEVIVADDGSGADTAALIAREQVDFPCPLRHVWQEDLGFRVARVRNLAVAASDGDYVLLIDGDMVLHPRFVEDHVRAARPGSFVQGMRVLTTPAGRERMLREGVTRLRFADAGLRRRRHTLRIPLLSRLLLRLTRSRSRLSGIKTCNQGWWRRDLLALNGFDERMQGWGREDEELALRAFHRGLARRSLRFGALAFHLHHPERHRDGASPNDALLAEALGRKLTRCDHGIDSHLPRPMSVDQTD